MNYDIVIIGGGLGGLSAGVKLSNEGKKVAILEKHHMVGGYATNFRRKDKDGNFYTFDTALHGIGGLRENNPLNIHLKDLDIFDDIEFLEKPETATIINLKGEELDIPSNFDDYKNYLIKRFKSYESGIEKLFDFLMEFKKDMTEVSKNEGQMPKYQNYLCSLTLDEFLRSYVDDDDFIEEFSFLWLYYGLPQKQSNAFYYIAPWVSYHIGGTYYVKGGAGKLSEVFKNKIIKNGSEVFTSSEVVKIDYSNNKITSVTTKKGDKFIADKFIIACDPNHIYSLIYDNNDIRKYKDKLNSLDKGISLTQLYLGLDVKSSELGMTKGDYFIEVSKNQETYEAIKNGDYDKMSFGVTCYDILDETLNNDNLGVITIIVGDLITNWPEYKTLEYKKRKEEVANKLIEKAEKMFPNIKSHIKVLELGTPHTMKRYTNNTEGAVYGWAQSVGQGGFDRLKFKTSFDNTFLSGAWTNPGGGFEGAIISGVLCSNRILREEMSNSSNKSINENQKIMASKVFMAGMCANLNKEKAVDCNIEFDFTDDNKFYLQIKNKKAKILDKKPKNIDVSIITTYKTWYEIGFLKKDGQQAYIDGELTINGSTEIFMQIPKMFEQKIKEEKPQRKLNSIIGVNLALIPWIIYWILGDKISSLTMEFLAILSTVIFVGFIKPKKEVTLLELTGILVFSNFLSSIKYLPDISLIIVFLLSVLINKPLTGEYSKFEFNSEMVKTNLFLNINKFLSLMWAVIFSLKFIIKLLIPYPINNISYSLIIIGIIISIIYPKKKLGE